MKKATIGMILLIMIGLSGCSWFDRLNPSEKILIVGSDTISGNFMMGFDNEKADVWVHTLIHGYSTYTMTPFGEIVLNETVVENVETTTDPITKHKTYTFTIHDDLYWSDGNAITANDFLFSMLLSASKEWNLAGANSTLGEKLVGYDAYNESPTSEDVNFSGLKGIDDHTFSLTIDAIYLPYFYETSYVNLYPLPMHHLTPETAVITSDTHGTRMNTDGFDSIADIVRIGGYRYIPLVTAGPYRFESFADQEVTLIKDPLFKGDYRGHKPSIDRVLIKQITIYQGVHKVIDGEIDLLTEGIYDAELEAVTLSETANSGYFTRNGFGFLAPVAHFGPTSDYRVRQAIAYLTDNPLAIDELLGGYGTSIYAEYGSTQWMAESNKIWMDEHLNPYTFSIDDAHAVLDQTEWIFESDGATLFDKTLTDENGSYLRHNADGEVLKIHHFMTESCVVYDRDYFLFKTRMPLAGIHFTTTTGSFDTLLNHYYYAYNLEETEKTYNLFNLGTTFTEAYDPYWTWHSDHLGTWRNAAQFEDSSTHAQAPLKEGELTLDELMVAMRETDPSDKETYLTLWKAYQLRWNMLVPAIPVYANHYYYVYGNHVKNVSLTIFWDWTKAIVDMTIE